MNLKKGNLYSHKNKESFSGYSHDGIYVLVDFVRLKDIETGDWYDAVMYKNINKEELYVREKNNFINKFKELKSMNKSGKLKINLGKVDVKVKKTYKDAVVPYKTYLDDFCYDCVATSCEEVAPNVYKYGIGLAFQIERDTLPFNGMNLSIDFRPRSSVWKTGMILSNCQGTIDEIYRGEVCAVFYHVFTDMPKYKVGDRIGQIKLGFTLPIEFEEVDELNETSRNCGGYGSTGK